MNTKNNNNNKYKIKFTEKQINVFNTKIESDSIRNSAMSIFSYFIKLINESGTEELLISLRKFLKRYTRYHKKIGLTCLNERFNLLQEIGLLNIRREPRKSYYSIANLYNNSNDNTSFNNDMNNNTNDKMNDKKVAQDVDISNISIDDELHKHQSIKSLDFINYYNTPAEAVAKAKEVLKALNIKSKWVINATIGKVKQIYATIGVNGSWNYIATMVNKFQAISKANYLQAKKLIKKKNKTPLNFQNYDQRPVDYDSIEDELVCNFDDIVITNPVPVASSVAPADKCDKYKLFLNTAMTTEEFNILEKFDINTIKKLAIKFSCKSGIRPSASDLIPSLT